jgi:hypothetical protein
MKKNTGDYEIKLKGHLDARGCAWFEGWSITNLENGEALLKSASVDQSRLHGALERIRDLNLMLISVTRVNPSTQDSNKERKNE